VIFKPSARLSQRETDETGPACFLYVCQSLMGPYPQPALKCDLSCWRGRGAARRSSLETSVCAQSAFALAAAEQNSTPFNETDRVSAERDLPGS